MSEIIDDFDDWNAHYEEFYPLGARADREFRVARLLVLASRKWTYRIDNILRRRTGQTRARWQILFSIAFAEQPVTLSEIGRRAEVQWPTLVRVIEGMEREGLIKREANPSDRRSKLMSLTPEGERVLRLIQPTLDQERAALLAKLSDAELDACATLLTSVYETARARSLAPTKFAGDE